MDEPLFLVFLGAPGSGKGTQADILSEKRGLVHLSSGDLFRENIAKGTELGRAVKEILSRGELVPDDLTVAMVMQRLAEPDTAGGVIFDGFPRTEGQAKALETEMDKTGKRITCAVHFQIDDKAIVDRLAARRVCPKDGIVYNLISNPPKFDNVCDADGTELVQRDDDKPETVRKRLEVYRTQTEPVLNFYRQRGNIADIDATRSIEDVQSQLESLLREIDAHRNQVV